MQVILTEKIRKLGDLGQLVGVKPGYARNFLIPQKKAMQATKKNLEVFETKRAALEKHAAEGLAAAQAQGEKLEAISLEVTANCGEGGKLFGSIGAKDIAQYITDKGIEVGKHQVKLPHGVFREVGEFEFVVHLHTDVDVAMQLKISPEKTES